MPKGQRQRWLELLSYIMALLREDVVKRAAKNTAAVVGVVGFLVLASYETTSIEWVGGFPSAQFHVNVCDSEGKPIRGAVLRVYRSGTHDMASSYRLDDRLTGQEPASDDTGRITAICKYGLNFGGDSWRLLWIVPMGAQAPKLDCEIAAPGFRPLNFPLWRLYESPHVSYGDFPKARLTMDGKEVELPIYEHTLTLER
jgi:hypothetical protein